MINHRLTGILLLALFFAVLTSRGQEEFFNDYHPELNWRTIETDHFYVHYHEGAERTARVVAKIAEEIHEPITSLYNYEPDGKVSFIIKDYDDFSNGAAYFFDNKVEIWASSLDFDLRGTHNWLRNVIAHEYTHIIQIQTSLKFGRKVPAVYLQWLGYESERRTDVLYGYPNIIASYPISGFVIPSWFAEGVAQYNRRQFQYDYWDAHRDMILRSYVLDNSMLSWNAMSVFGKTSLGNESSYNAGFSLVNYIAHQYGEDKLVEISRNLSSLTALTIDGAIEKALGKSGEDVYEEWKAHLRSDYLARTASLKSALVEGEIIADVGFGNFYPAFSPDGRSVAYVSNKKADYFGLSSLYLYDVTTKAEKRLQAGVRSNISWSPDGKKIYFSRIGPDNDHGSNFSDIYAYDLAKEEETRLTHGLRVSSPAVSPDGSGIACIVGRDGTLNVALLDSGGGNLRMLTSYADGEQVYNPKWSTGGDTILFGYSYRDGRDIAGVARSGGAPFFLLATPDDERNAVFTHDGTAIVYASDKSGIFNLYSLDLATKVSTQLTNVLGGAFMPSVDDSGKTAFARYTSGGYKIALLQESPALRDPPRYVRVDHRRFEMGEDLVSAGNEVGTRQFDWQSLRSYDDTRLPPLKDTTYRGISSSLTFVPFLRVDNYNPKNKGIDVIKPGLYIFSYDILDRYGFFGGVAMNLRGERDIFVTFDYRGRIPGLFALGLTPALSFEIFNITRKTEANVNLPLDTIGVGVTYNLLEFDVVLRHKLLTEHAGIELRYAHSRYSASISSFFINESNTLVSATSDLYLLGNTLSATMTMTSFVPSRTMEINPVGRKIRFRYDYEFNKFNPNGEYDIDNGLLVPRYENINFHRLDLGWREHMALPGWKHTLTTRLRGGSILGEPVDDFFDFYIGGLAGMKGYPFYSLGGNEFLHANLTYRFPVWENIDVRLLHLYFDKLYAGVYGDVGNAWTGGGPPGKRFKRDLGLELRLEAFSYYAYPTRIFFNATYGLDRFERYVASSATTVTYGKEWNFHFGVLFGFELD